MALKMALDFDTLHFHTFSLILEWVNPLVFPWALGKGKPIFTRDHGIEEDDAKPFEKISSTAMDFF